MKCPVVRLELALYGHKHSGNFWEEHCHDRCLDAGFTAVGEEWPGVYWDDDNKLLLIVYVDDMKLSGPAHEHAAAWKRLGANDRSKRTRRR